MHEQVEIFNQAILNVSHIFFPNKTILCDDRVSPWVKEKIKTLIKKKNNAFYRSQRNTINFEYTTLDATTLEVSYAKTKYYECFAINLDDPETASNWSVSKTLNGNGKWYIQRYQLYHRC